MQPDDIPAAHALSRAVHADYPEREAVLAEKQRLFPAGCFVLDAGRDIAGYAFSHPWIDGAAPSLDTLLGTLPAAPSAYFIHDVTLIADMRRKAPEVFAEGMRVIEDEYFRRPWVMGEAYTICDPYLFTVAGWLPRDGIDMARFPKIADHFERMKARPAVSKVLAQLAG